jgi:hypothetical protein
MSHTMKLWERIIEHRLRGLPTSPKTNLVLCQGDQLWRRFLDKATYREIYGAKEIPAYSLYLTGEVI